MGRVAELMSYTGNVTWLLQLKEIERHFRRYDVDNTGTLDASEVKRLLQDLNDVKCAACTKKMRDAHHDLTAIKDDCPVCARIATVSNKEVEWVISSADTDGSGTLDHLELLAAASWWYLHVTRGEINAVTGCHALIPWASATVVGTSNLICHTLFLMCFYMCTSHL